MKTIVFSDLDGTILNNEYIITPLTLSAIKNLNQEDILFVIISARSPLGIYPILKKYDMDCTIVAYSGALIIDHNNKILYHHGMTKNNASMIISFIERNNFDLSWNIYSYNNWIVKDKMDPRIINEEQIVKTESNEGIIDSIQDDEIHKILCICNPIQIDAIENTLKKEFPQYYIVKSSGELLEIMEKNVSKDRAVKKLCELWDVNISNTIAFGDSYNDYEMLESVGYGYLMNNAPDDLKDKIKLHTKDNNSDGIYYALKNHFDNNTV